MSHNERAHAKLSGSIAHIWSVCYGAPALWAKLPKSPPSEASLRGTFVHEVGEKALRNFLNQKVTGEYSDPNWAAGVDAVAVDTANGYVKAIWEEVLEQSLTGKAWGIEEEVCLDRALEMYGIVDFWCIYIDDRGQRVLAICDLKNGFHYVEVKKNAQFLFYACSLLKEIRSLGKDLDCVRICKFQPNAANHEPYEEARYSAKQLDKWSQAFFRAAREILQGNTKLKVGNHCEFCNAKGICPAYGKSISDKAALALIDVEKIELPKIEQIPDEQLKKLILYGPMVEDFLSSVKAYAISRAKNGSPIKGLKLINGPTRRTWREQEEVIAKTLQSLGVKEPWRKQLITITEAQKITGKDALTNLVTTTKPCLQLVSEDDPRPSVENALNVLGEIDNGKDV